MDFVALHYTDENGAPAKLRATKEHLVYVAPSSNAAPASAPLDRLPPGGFARCGRGPSCRAPNDWGRCASPPNRNRPAPPRHAAPRAPPETGPRPAQAAPPRPPHPASKGAPTASTPVTSWWSAPRRRRPAARPFTTPPA
jgi:hypothetical protein